MVSTNTKNTSVGTTPKAKKEKATKVSKEDREMDDDESDIDLRERSGAKKSQQPKSGDKMDIDSPEKPGAKKRKQTRDDDEMDYDSSEESGAKKSKQTNNKKEETIGSSTVQVPKNPVSSNALKTYMTKCRLQYNPRTLSTASGPELSISNPFGQNNQTEITQGDVEQICERMTFALNYADAFTPMPMPVSFVAENSYTSRAIAGDEQRLIDQGTLIIPVSQVMAKSLVRSNNKREIRPETRFGVAFVLLVLYVLYTLFFVSSVFDMTGCHYTKFTFVIFCICILVGFKSLRVMAMLITVFFAMSMLGWAFGCNICRKPSPVSNFTCSCPPVNLSCAVGDKNETPPEPCKECAPCVCPNNTVLVVANQTDVEKKAKITEAIRIARLIKANEDARVAEAARAAEAKRIAEEARIVEAERIKEAKRIEEAARVAEAELAEEAKLAEEANKKAELDKPKPVAEPSPSQPQIVGDEDLDIGF